ncbi:MAG TPA: hypothetical protein VFM69_06460 [Pricia sp.]|nr:hypothetical protein [Pricia sp.]
MDVNKKTILKEFLSGGDNTVKAISKRTGLSYYLVDKTINDHLEGKTVYDKNLDMLFNDRP